jgi:hypothetical protein
MLNDELLSLASAAAETIVIAAAGDGWTKVKQAFARLLGRGDRPPAGAAAKRLDETRAELAAVTGPDLEDARGRLRAAWRTRLSDLLEEAPELAVELRVLVQQIQADPQARPVSASGTGMAAGHDINVTASGGGMAAGTVAGSFLAVNPTQPGPAS